ncbi:hypothetical protein K435DRAFT_809467 [Dendrothele bispora CBS 962.96]|uniref:Uncharacterized protein n=1 Tax=Dendrothele bispora (strain CBS 962.96) TaxID=1314807 RepID=A0A4S8KZ97_DENBC|nr:hypothetical protein K435DRAFT_809467 [Dendrothele bispora CBS 962.96]
MQSTTSLAAKRSCSSCSTHDHPLEGCRPLADNGATAWILANQPDVTSFQPTSNCTELVPYWPSPFPPLESKPVQGSTPIDPVTGALLGFNCENLIDILHLAFPDPYIRAIITHAFRDSILSQPLSDDQLMVFRDETGQTTRIFFSVETADRIWSDLRRLGQMVLSATNLSDPSAPIPLAYSRDFNNLEWVQSDFSRLIPHITFAGSDNLLRSIFGSTRQSMQQIYTLIQFVAQKYALWIVQQVRNSISRGYLSICNWGSYFGLTHDETLTRLTRKSMARLNAEKKLARRRSEKAKLRKARSDEDVTMGLVLHPTASLPGQQGLLTPYTPNQPGWSIDAYAPSADVHMADEDFGEMMVDAATSFNREF